MMEKYLAAGYEHMFLKVTEQKFFFIYIYSNLNTFLIGNIKACLMAVFDVNQALSTSKYLQSQKKRC